MDKKLMEGLFSIGCKSRKEAAIGMQIYLHLTEKEKFHDVEYKFNSCLDCLYFTAKKSKLAEANIFIPIASSEKITVALLEKYLDAMKDESKNGITLAICSPDSTCLFYEVSSGIGDPPSAESHTISRESKRTRVDKVLHRNKSVLEQAAMYGLPVTLAKDCKTEAACESENYSD